VSRTINQMALAGVSVLKHTHDLLLVVYTMSRGPLPEFRKAGASDQSICAPGSFF
jgi:hypothetical protein